MNARKIAAFAVGPIGAALLSLISLPVVAWLYPAEDVGRLAMLQVALSLCVQIFTFGLDQAYVREFHESLNRPQLLKMTMLPGLLFLSVLLTAAMLMPGSLSSLLFDFPDMAVSAFVALCLLSTLLARFLSLILRMQERGLAFSMGQLLPKFIFLLFLAAYYLFSFGREFSYLVFAQSAAVITIAAIYLYGTRTEWRSALTQKIDWIKLRAMLAFGMPLLLGGLAYWGLTMQDRLFLRNMSTFSELGIYSIASSIAGAAMIIQSVFSTVWAPTVYKWVAEGVDPERVDRVSESLLAIVVFVFCMTGIFSGLITYFLPPAYQRVEYMVAACMGFPLLYTLSETTVVGLGVARKTSLSMLASIIAAAVSLLGNFLLVPRYGAAGAAVATMFAFWVFLVCRTEFSSIVWRSLPRKKIYILTLLCTSMAAAMALAGNAHSIWLLRAGWVLLFLVSIFLFKSLLAQLPSSIRALRSGA